jgi:hypothetical protein
VTTSHRQPGTANDPTTTAIDADEVLGTHKWRARASDVLNRRYRYPRATRSPALERIPYSCGRSARHHLDTRRARSDARRLGRRRTEGEPNPSVRRVPTPAFTSSALFVGNSAPPGKDYFAQTAFSTPKKIENRRPIQQRRHMALGAISRWSMTRAPKPFSIADAQPADIDLCYRVVGLVLVQRCARSAMAVVSPSMAATTAFS